MDRFKPQITPTRILLVAGTVLFFSLIVLNLINLNNSENSLFYQSQFNINNNNVRKQQSSNIPQQKQSDKRILLLKEIIDTNIKQGIKLDIKHVESPTWYQSVSKYLSSSSTDNNSNSNNDNNDNSNYSYINGRKNLFIVQFKDMQSDSMNLLKEFLEMSDDGSRLHSSKIINYVPNDSFLVYMSVKQSKILLTKTWVQWVGEYDIHHKVYIDFNNKDPSLVGAPVYVLTATSEINRSSIDSLIESWTKSLNNKILSYTKYISVQLTYASNTKLKALVQCRSGSACDISEILFIEKVVYSWISEQPESYFLERAERVKMANKFAPKTMFSNFDGNQVQNDLRDIPLRGKDQIIGIADTGLDKDHCFFSDPSQPFPFNTINNNHRKVVTYITYKDDADDVSGHGTHVAGSAAGAPSDPSLPIANYSGVARESKIAFFDIATLGNSNPFPPDDLTVMYDQIYKAGARVHGDSWGAFSNQGRNGAYGTGASEIDAFLYNHRDMLIIRAAGNDGDKGYLSILTQSTAKNILTVGAQMNVFESFIDSVPFREIDGQAAMNLRTFCLFDSKYCSYTTDQCCTEGTTTTAVGLQNCCPSILKTNATASYTGANAQFNENNMASFSSRGPTHDGRLKPEVVAPGYYITSANSNGPNTTDQCASGATSESLLSIGGTSMATPLVTGSAAILRQYLTEGFYPTGEPVTGNIINPTGALVKALLINNAHLLNGTIELDDGPIAMENNNPFSNASLIQGFGAVRMGNILYFKNQPRAFNRWVGIGGFQQSQQWGEDYVNTTRSVSYCVRYRKDPNDSTKPVVKGTLVWTDPPSIPSARTNLVNNIDLVMSYVPEPKNVTIYVIANESPSSTSLTPSPDSINNVEQITFSPPEDNLLMRFTVKGTNIPIAPQTFTFVASGEHGIFEWADDCPQCAIGDSQACSVLNGEGSQTCQDDLQWSACIVSSCATGFNYNSLSKQCVKFLSYNYIIMIVAGGTMILITLAILFIKYLEHKEKKGIDFKKFDDGSGMYVKPKSKDAKVTVPDLYALVSPFIFELIISTACSLISTAASILQPFYIGNIINAIPTTKYMSDMRTDFIYIFLLALIEFLFSTISSWISGIVNEKMIMRLQNKVFRALIAQDMGFFQKNNAATLMNVLIVDSPMLRSALTGILLAIATGICKFVGSLVFIFTISWKLSLAFFGTIPVLALVTQIQAKFSKRLTRTLLYFNSKASQHGTESMVNMHVVTNYCTQDKEIKKYTAQLMDVFITARKLIINNTLASSVKWLMVESLAFTILYYGTYLSIHKEFSVGLLISFSLYIGYVIESSNTLFGVYISYIQSLASAHRVFMILRSAPRKRTTLEEEQADYLEKIQQEGGGGASATSGNIGIDSTNDPNNNNNNNDNNTPIDPNNNNTNNDNPNNNNNNNNNDNNPNNDPSIDPNNNNNMAIVGEDNTKDESVIDTDSNLDLTTKELKKKKKEQQKEFYKQTGISVVEMNILPSTYVDFTSCNGEIEFKNVSFSYPTRPDVEVLHNINMKFEAGKCYGLVGPSGSGKSTALELISKFYQLKKGSILLDDTDINKIRPNNLRSFVTCVHQQPYLFDASISENIGYALDDPNIKDIMEAAKLANAHEFIQELPNQYDTVLGSAGNLLSGGQKKRIAVARAICSKRKIMLLDEITAELDPESEEAITNSIKKLTQGHTVVMVAHKVAAVRECDKIFVLEKGYLVEEGTHDELMNKRGRYYRMFHDRDELELPLNNDDPNNNNNNNNILN